MKALQLFKVNEHVSILEGFFLKEPFQGTSLAVQWLKDSPFQHRRVWVQHLAGELRSHMPQGATNNSNKKGPSTIFSI